MSAHDAWLEAPYQDHYEAAEAFSDYANDRLPRLRANDAVYGEAIKDAFDDPRKLSMLCKLLRDSDYIAFGQLLERHADAELMQMVDDEFNGDREVTP